MTPVLTHSINSDMQQMLAFLWPLFLAGKGHLKASIVKHLLFSPGGLDPGIPLLPEVIRRENNILITWKSTILIQLIKFKHFCSTSPPWDTKITLLENGTLAIRKKVSTLWKGNLVILLLSTLRSEASTSFTDYWEGASTSSPSSAGGI